MLPSPALHICLEQSVMPVNQGAEMNTLCFRSSKENQFSRKNLSIQQHVFLPSEFISGRKVKIILFPPLPVTRNGKLEGVQSFEAASDNLQVTTCILFAEGFSW